MATEMLQIDDLLIDKFNPYAVPGRDTFSPGLPQMLGGYKGRSTLEWYDPEPVKSPFAPEDKTIACGMPSVGDYTTDYVSKPARVLNNQPGWQMEFDGLAPLIKSDYGLTTYLDKKVRKCDGPLSQFLYDKTGMVIPNFFIVVLLMIALVALVIQKD